MTITSVMIHVIYLLEEEKNIKAYTTPTDW